MRLRELALCAPRAENLHLPQVGVSAALMVAQQSQLHVEGAQSLALAAGGVSRVQRSSLATPSATHFGFPSTGWVSARCTHPVGSSRLAVATSWAGVSGRARRPACTHPQLRHAVAHAHGYQLGRVALVQLELRVQSQLLRGGVRRALGLARLRAHQQLHSPLEGDVHHVARSPVRPGGDEDSERCGSESTRRTALRERTASTSPRCCLAAAPPRWPPWRWSRSRWPGLQSPSCPRRASADRSARQPLSGCRGAPWSSCRAAVLADKLH